ncbi:hypothetical protein JL100_026470 [Skermanella mucosa]|uniref:hypothetical protein n=1 Tax=Skermanella mucosa TaxID=1789672 RepID=UPI001E3B357F|nr:hypothetical protein [Skermanella mucosa]UEM20582.1 hypothetical protein JL100_026470 [Skermanella mucosa]
MLAAVIPLTAACSGTDGQPPAAAEANAVPLACPRVTIPEETREVTRFRAGGRDLTDVTSRAAVLDYTGGCEYGRDGVTVNLNLVLGAERGPGTRDTQGAYRYFVAITDPSGRIVAKREFDTTIDFSPNVGRGGSIEELQQQIPLPEGASAANYGVVVGFQLDPAELEFNRSPQRNF